MVKNIHTQNQGWQLLKKQKRKRNLGGVKSNEFVGKYEQKASFRDF